MFLSTRILFLGISTHNLKKDKGSTSPGTSIRKTKHTIHKLKHLLRAQKMPERCAPPRHNNIDDNRKGLRMHKIMLSILEVIIDHGSTFVTYRKLGLGLGCILTNSIGLSISERTLY